MAAFDRARDNASPLHADIPARDAGAVTASDLTDFASYPRALFVGVGGDVSLVPVASAADTGVVFKNVVSGTILPIQSRRVNSTGTTATDIVALY